MPQRLGPPAPEPDRRRNNDDKINDAFGTDIGTKLQAFHSPSHIIERLGPRGVQDALTAAGYTRSRRTVRAWKQHNRVPDPTILTVLERADLIKRAGGIDAAAKAWGRSASTIAKWSRNPHQQLRGDAATKAGQQNRGDRCRAAGLPVDDKGRFTKRLKITIDATMVYTGPSLSEYDERRRHIERYLNFPGWEAFAEQLWIANANGDQGQVQALLEEYLNDHYLNEHLDDGFDDGFDEIGGLEITEINSIDFDFE